MCFGTSEKSRPRRMYNAGIRSGSDIASTSRARKLNPNWDPKNPYDYPKYYYDPVDPDQPVEGGNQGGGGGPSQRGGYQPVQGMSHRGGSRAAGNGSTHMMMGGRNNPYEGGRSVATAVGTSRGGASHRSGGSTRFDPRSHGSSNASGRRSGNNPPSYMSGRGTARSAPLPDGMFARGNNGGNHSRNSTAAAHSEMPSSRFSSDNVRRRPSPPPLHPRR